jgi:hypothetical protein
MIRETRVTIDRALEMLDTRSDPDAPGTTGCRRQTGIAIC